MKTLKYKVACKSCLNTDGIDHMIIISNGYSDFFENRMLKSEYDLGKYIKTYLKNNDKSCQFCRSNNLEISDIEIEGRKASIGREVTQFQLVITKYENGQIAIKTGGSQLLPKGFMTEALRLIEQAIKETPKSEFEEKHIGNVRFVVATGFIGDDDHRTNRLESFSFVGFDKDTVESIIGDVKLQLIKTNH